MKRTLLVATAAATLLLTGCTTTGSSEPKSTKTEAATLDAATVKSAIDAAEARYKEALKMKAAWRHTKKAIENARKHLEKNELEKAMKLAKEAQYESDQAIMQSQEADQTWQNAMPK